MPVMFEYAPRNTPIHRMNPLAKTIMLVCMFTLISLYWDLRYLAILALIAAIIYIVSKTPPKWMLLSIPFGAYRFIEASILGLTQSEEAFAVLGELAGKVLFQLGPYYIFGYQIGPLTLIYGGFHWALAYIFRIVIVMALTFTFIYSTSLNDLIKSLTCIKMPSQVIYILIVALKFVPEIWREFYLTSLAQSLRGWKLKTKNPVKLFKMAAPIVNPFTRRIISYVDRLSLTVQIRGFGATKVKYPWKIHFSVFDWAISILSVVGTAYALYLLFMFGMGTI